MNAVLRCGVIAVIGRPNVGKSSLMNALIQEHLSITSSKPQTTRHQVVGVLTETIDHTAAQFIFVDTPGFQTKHVSALNKSMNQTVRNALADVNTVLWVIDGSHLHTVDEKVLRLCSDSVPVIAVINKIDTLANKNEVLPIIQKVSELYSFHAIVPVSAKKTLNLDQLKRAMLETLPEQAFFYDADTLTNRSEKFLAAERIREKLFRLVGDELPYNSTVVIDEFKFENNRRFIYATILVDRPSHKAMIIGKDGSKLKRIATEARADMEKLFNGSVHLETWVKVRSGWADDASVLKSLGYE